MINRIKDPPIKLQLKPERNNTKSPEEAIINAVPRSGCLKTKKKQQKIIIKLMRFDFAIFWNFYSLSVDVKSMNITV